MRNQRLLAVEDEIGAVRARARGDIVERVARLPLAVREGKPQAAGGDLRQDVVLHCGRAAEPHQAAAEHDRGEIRRARERAAEFLHHDHDLDRAARDPAMALSKRQPEQAKLGIALPLAPVEAVRCDRARGARSEQPAHAVLQQALLLGEFEIHHNPSIALAMMFFWISLLPP